MTATTSRSDFQLPAELSPLCDLPRWIGWRLVTRGGKTTKPPISLRTGQIISIKNESEWTSYRRALRLISDGDLEIDGLGFVLLDTEICAFDLDQCIHKGEIVPWARRLIDRTHSYVERTPSGYGLRILGFGTGRPVHIKKKINAGGSFEIYRRATRYITISGNAFDGAELEDIDRLIDELVEEHGGFASVSPEAKIKQPIEIDDIDDDLAPFEIIAHFQCRGSKCTRSRGKGCKELRQMMRHVPNGSRSDVCWKLGRVLREHGATPDQVATVLSESEAFQSKHGTSETALAGEVERIFEKPLGVS